MYIKPVTYTDYNGNQRTENLHFNLSRAELAEMELSSDNGMEALLRRMIEEKNNKKLYNFFKEFVLMSYGEKSLDGKRFIKKDPETGRPLSEAFQETEAYSELIMELIQSDETMATFITNVMPTEVQDEIGKQGGINKMLENANNGEIVPMPAG